MAVLANGSRLLRILRLVAAFLVARTLGQRLRAWPLLARLWPSLEAPGPILLRRLFEDLGGTFVKLGQMLALQPDILSPEYCNALFDLLDRVEPFPYSEVQRIVTEELGRPPEEVFDSFDPRPLATASVGQVHVACLAGQKVAVKVQRPRVEAELASDLRLVSAAMAAIRWLRLRPLAWLLEPMTEFVGWTWEELDYRNEARSSERLRSLAADNPIQKVPRVYAEHTTRRVLVVEFLEGVTLLDYLRARERGDEVLQARLKAMGFDGRKLAGHVIDNFLGDAFRNGIYHADLHPANLMILPGNVVGYIDFGITGVLSPYARRHLMVMTLGLARGDIEAIHSQFLNLSVYGPGSDLAGFHDGLLTLAAAWYEREGGRPRLRVNFTRVMTDMLQLSRRTNVMPERAIVKYIRSAIAIDGVNLRFEPGFHVGTYLEEQCGRLLQWQTVRTAMSDDTLLSWSSMGTRLLTEGPAQAGQLLDRLLRGDLVVRAQQTGGDPRGELRARAIHLAATVFTLVVLMVATGPPVVLGWNLFTTESSLVLLGLGLLMPALRRLA